MGIYALYLTNRPKFYRARHITHSLSWVKKDLNGTGEVWDNENSIYLP